MMPRLTRRAWIVGVLCVAGCNYPLIRSQNPEEEDLSYLADAEPDDDITELIGQSTVPMGLKPLKIQGVGLVNGLANTGSDPSPSSYKNSLIAEMQSYEVKNPDKVLESLENSLVIVRGWLPPGVEKGDPYDIEVVIPPKSKTTSLRSGFLMRCRMREMRYAQADNMVHSGSVSGLAQGHVIVDAVFLGDGDEAKEVRGRVIGGGQSQITRPLGIAIRGDKSVKKSAAIGAAINARFQRSDRNGQTGVATPKRDNYIELAVHPRYKNNLARYVMVIRNIAVRETPSERVMRVAALERRLLEPTTSARAALQLEAIGEEGVPVLVKGLTSASREVRFYSAEALAYLDREEAAPALLEAAREIPAFRWHALTALAAMDHVAAYEVLNELLHVPSTETRYGAFRAMRIRNAADPLVRGESLGGGFAYHVIDTSGPALVHISKWQRPEIVLFGQRQKVVPPAFLFAGKDIMIKGQEDGRLRLTRFQSGMKEDQQEICDATVDQMIRAIVRLGGGYADVIQALQEARKGGYLESKLAVNAIARPGREYDRSTDLDESAPADPATAAIRPAHPVPEMFSDRLESDDSDKDKSDYEPDEIEATEETDDEAAAEDSFLGKMSNWFTP